MLKVSLNLTVFMSKHSYIKDYIASLAMIMFCYISERHALLLGASFSSHGLVIRGQ